MQALNTIWLTPNEAAKEARMSRATLYNRWALGCGPRYSQVGGRRLIRADWLQDWLMEQEVAA